LCLVDFACYVNPTYVTIFDPSIATSPFELGINSPQRTNWNAPDSWAVIDPNVQSPNSWSSNTLDPDIPFLTFPSQEPPPTAIAKKDSLKSNEKEATVKKRD